MKKNLYVIAHGHKAHSVQELNSSGWLTDCGLIIPQMRPALTRDRRCKNCVKERSILKKIKLGKTPKLPRNPSSAFTARELKRRGK